MHRQKDNSSKWKSPCYNLGRTGTAIAKPCRLPKWSQAQGPNELISLAELDHTYGWSLVAMHPACETVWTYSSPPHVSTNILFQSLSIVRFRPLCRFETHSAGINYSKPRHHCIEVLEGQVQLRRIWQRMLLMRWGHLCLLKRLRYYLLEI